MNVCLAVGPRRADGYHDLATVFQAVSLYDEVTAQPAGHLTVTVAGPEASLLPDGRSNLAARAALMVAARAARDPGVRIHVRKILLSRAGWPAGALTLPPRCWPATRCGTRAWEPQSCASWVRGWAATSPSCSPVARPSAGAAGSC